MYTISIFYQEIINWDAMETWDIIWKFPWCRNYSYLNASIGLSLAALYAGNIPNDKPIRIENQTAIMIDCKVIIHAITLFNANTIR